MKTFTPALIVLVTSLAVFGQGYKPELDGKFLPGKVMFFSDGVIYDVLIKYQQPEFFKNILNKFVISKGSESEAYEQTGGIEAFMVNGEIWAQRSIPASMAYRSNAERNLSKDFNAVVFVMLKRQGVIEQFEYVVNGENDNKPNQGFIILGARTKLVTRHTLRNEIVEGDVTLEKLKEWIADSPEAVEDMKQAEEAAAAAKSAPAKPTSQSAPAKKGLMGMLEQAKAKANEAKSEEATRVDVGRIINNYNVGYESRNPGKVKYYFAPSMNWIQLPTKVKSFEALKAERQAVIDKAYSNRSTVVSTELASAKDNIPVKKETFIGKLSRIKADGNKVGVWINVMPARSVKNEMGGLINYATLEGEYLDETLHTAGQQLVDALNAAYSTTDFELIDLSNIPYKEVKVLGQTARVDDWWASKYKVVFKYTVDPRLEGENKEVSGKTKFVSSINFLQMLIVTEYIGGPTSNKQDILTQILNFGAYRSPYHSQDDEIKEAKNMYEKVMSKMEGSVLDQLKTERADKMSKLVNRLGN
jgi:hypothetical protein